MGKRAKAARRARPMRARAERTTAVGARSAAGVPASELKNSLHEILERVRRTREEVVITRYGKPIARLAPVGPAPEAPRQGFVGSMAGTVTTLGDIIEPIDVMWEADVC
jgi:prevent-host-death family protein